MKLTQQFRTIPKTWDEFPKNDGKEIVISDDITFKGAIDYIDSYCKEIDYFHHYSIRTIKPTWKYPERMEFNIHTQDPNRKLEGKCKVIMPEHENEIPPDIICIFTLYNKSDEHPRWCDTNYFNISKL